MAGKKEILKKIKIVLTAEFDNYEKAFRFFDKNSDEKIDKKELNNLLKKAKISGFIRGIVLQKLLDHFDQSNDGQLSWKEFKKAVKKL